MKKSDLTDFVFNSKKQLFAVVGPNASGKTFYLHNDLYLNLPDGSLLVDEEGRFLTKGNKKKIKINNNVYIYDNVEKRGTNDITFEKEEMTVESSRIILEIGKMINKINVLNKSLGTRKLHNILNALSSYNLNHIEYVLFDEPENSLDDEGIKCIEKIFNALIKNGKKVFFITHSPRLLELLQVDIDDIYLFPKIYSDIINVKKDEIFDLFDSNGEEIEYLKPAQPCCNYEKFDFLPKTKLRNIYIKELIHSSEFYRTLFYSHVVIVEGKTEDLIIRRFINELPVSKCIFPSGGKYKMPFLIKLFSLFCDKITCVIDSDEPKDGVSTLPSLLTDLIESKRSSQCKVYSIPRNLEMFLNYDKIEIIRILSNDLFPISNKFLNKFGNYYKPYIPLYVIENDTTSISKIRSIFIDEAEEYEF